MKIQPKKHSYWKLEFVSKTNLAHPSFFFLFLSVLKCPGAGAGGPAEPTAAGTQGANGCGRWTQGPWLTAQPRWLALNVHICIICSLTSLFSCLPLRPPEDGEGARSREADPEWDVGGGGAARCPGGPLGGAEASGEGGGQGPGGRDALQRLQPQLGLNELTHARRSLLRMAVFDQNSLLNTCSSECVKTPPQHTQTLRLPLTLQQSATFTYPLPKGSPS